MVAPKLIFERLKGEFLAAMEACRERPKKEAVHSLRTSARRIEALLGATKARRRGDAEFGRKVARTLKALKPIRQAAGPMRDVDVQRELLAGLAGRRSGLEDLVGEGRKVEAALKRDRKEAEAELVSRIDGTRDAAIEALNGLASTLISSEWKLLLKDAKAFERKAAKRLDIANPESLHDYRKGAKFARYLAEMDDSAAAKHFAVSIKRVLDAIGRWHDWMLLAEVARETVGKASTLAGALRKERNRSRGRAIRLVKGWGRGV
jgi:CHAD domain-containing protein